MAPIRGGGGEESLILQKVEEISRKQDGIPTLLSDLERRQNQSLDTLRRDFERMFVSHAEYDPKHQILLDRMHEYDRIIMDGRVRQEDYAVVKSQVQDHEEEIKHIKEHTSSWPSRLLPWIAVAISSAAVLLNYAQHIAIR